MSINSTIADCSSVLEEASTVVIPVPGNYFLILLLICLSGLFSGLTLGLLSLDKMGLQIVIGGGDPVLAGYARAILPVRERGNQLLCTLLLGNVAVNSLLSILMADMTSGLVGFFSSTILIVIFGEIIPQASCSRHALLIGYYTIYITKFFMLVLFFAAYPLGLMLDYALGEDLGTIHSRRELTTLLDLHVKHGAVDIESGNMLSGALKFREMTVQEVMTPASEAFMVPLSETLNYALMKKIFRAGYSRIPVYDNDRNDIVGIILAKDLMLIQPQDDTPVRNFMTMFGIPPILVWPDQKLGDMLNVFKQGRGHIAIVRDVNNAGSGDPFYECTGIVTLEDIVEEILGQEINDELDEDTIEEGATGDVEHRNRDRDLAMLALLNGKMEEEKLSFEEVRAVASHLMNNVPQFEDTCKLLSNGSILDVSDVQTILSHASVIVADRQSTEGMLAHRNPQPDDILFDKSLPSDHCILVMAGKVVVYAGHDQFRSELGAWSVIGFDALRSKDSTFSPDFTAYILSDNIRYVLLTKEMFAENASSPVPRRNSKGRASAGVGKRSAFKTTRRSNNATMVVGPKDDAVMSPLWSPEPSASDQKKAQSSFELVSRSDRGRMNYERLGARKEDDMELIDTDMTGVARVVGEGEQESQFFWRRQCKAAQDYERNLDPVKVLMDQIQVIRLKTIKRFYVEPNGINFINHVL